jgi:hypothetical protein
MCQEKTHYPGDKPSARRGFRGSGVDVSNRRFPSTSFTLPRIAATCAKLAMLKEGVQRHSELPPVLNVPVQSRQRGGSTQ